MQQTFEDDPLHSITPDKWNNIPLCVVKSITLLRDHCLSKTNEAFNR